MAPAFELGPWLVVAIPAVVFLLALCLFWTGRGEQ